MTKIFTALQLRLMDLRSREEGQTFAEYGLILALVAIVLVVALGVLATGLDGNLRDVASHL